MSEAAKHLPPALRYHMQRVRMATTHRMDRKDVARWIEQNTTINGAPFSFKDHEYQERILSEEAPERVIRKSAQTGISEMSLREAAALPQIMLGAFRIGYVFPSASFAADYAQTRFSPIVQGSPALRAAISSADVDKADIKTFGSADKAVYFKGAAVGNAAISTTLDAIYFDEYDFMSQEVAGDYFSRLLHSPHKWTTKLSTPTVPGGPIDVAFTASRRHFNFCKCNHCGHLFLPSYYEHVRVPGWNDHLDAITSSNIHNARYQEAALHCPNCDRVPSLQPEHREWVCENPTENHRAVGFQVSPFDAPNIVTVPSLIVASTKYNSKTKFRQFSLGQPDEDADNGFTDEELDAAAIQVSGRPDGTYFLGFDQGAVCHLTVGFVGNDDILKVVHWERAPLGRFHERYNALKAQYGVRQTKVGDMQPNVTLAMQLVDEDSQFFPALYTVRQGLDVYEVKVRTEDDDAGRTMLRQISVNRNALFDRLLLEVREGRLLLGKTAEWELVKAHLRDMKRVSATLRNGEFASQWVKSSRAQDHYHHALGYLWLASQIRGIGGTVLTPDMFSVQKIRAPAI
jgi:hypothetical protein